MTFLLLIPLTLALAGLVHCIFALADSLTRWAPEPPTAGPGPTPVPAPPPPGLDFDDIAFHLALQDLIQRSNL